MSTWREWGMGKEGTKGREQEKSKEQEGELVTSIGALWVFHSTSNRRPME